MMHLKVTAIEGPAKCHYCLTRPCIYDCEEIIKKFQIMLGNDFVFQYHIGIKRKKKFFGLLLIDIWVYMLISNNRLQIKYCSLKEAKKRDYIVLKGLQTI